MVDPARHTGLPEGTLGDLSETSLSKKYLIQTRTDRRTEEISMMMPAFPQLCFEIERGNPMKIPLKFLAKAGINLKFCLRRNRRQRI